MIETTLSWITKRISLVVWRRDLLDMLPSWIGAFWRGITFFYNTNLLEWASRLFELLGRVFGFLFILNVNFWWEIFINRGKVFFFILIQIFGNGSFIIFIVPQLLFFFQCFSQNVRILLIYSHSKISTVFSVNICMTCHTCHCQKMTHTSAQS